MAIASFSSSSSFIINPLIIALSSRFPLLSLSSSSSSSSPFFLKSPPTSLCFSLLPRTRRPRSRSTTTAIAAMSYSSSSSSSPPTYEKELAAAKKAASLAARLCQTVQKALLQSDVQSKADRSPVTVADYGSQALVSLVLKTELSSESFSLVAEEDSGDLRKDGSQETLRRITKLVNDTLSSDGTYNISLSEEDVLVAIDSGKSEGGPHGRHWVLDPIDGTKGFLRGDQYAIALGLLDEGKVVLGVLACPNLPLATLGRSETESLASKVGCLFSARIGAGAYMQSLDGSPPSKVHVSNIETPADASFFESFEAAHSLHDLSSSIASKLGVRAPPVRIDSQAKYGALARGDGAIYLRFPHKGYREKIWDHAAGCIVVTEAGGIATDAAGNALDFSKGRYLDLDTGIIVTNEKLMPSLLNAVQSSLRERAQSASPL
ncbi:SAL1 phosphatase-like isoform X1 [Iris pallida]|uniref:3'(2'),5'-bisphosphate nucleotidase n=1 Tax=Iris pallida TaxID=29817 RepID=A0AAX6ESS0_IRIPA|nr:SAL1 phosphatase-like isoform X1 [Iris pallida]